MTFGEPDGLAKLLANVDPETRRKARRERQAAIAALIAVRPESGNVIEVDFRRERK